MNKRKAMIGWAVYSVAKRAFKSKAKGAVPGMKKSSRLPGLAAKVAGLGAVLGGLMFWRKRRSGHQTAGS